MSVKTLQFVQLKKQLDEKFDVYHDGFTNVLHLHKREDLKADSTSGLANILKVAHIGPGSFGIYAPTATKQFWGVRKPLLEKLQKLYKDNWALVLLEESSAVGYYYNPSDVRNSASSWSADASGEDFKITAANLGYMRSFTSFEELRGLLRESGVEQ